MRTYLHTLMGYAGLVYRKTKGVLSAQQEENLKKILISAEQLREAIDRLNEFPFEDEPE